jgi:two-component system sensor histidine kinase DegS
MNTIEIYLKKIRDDLIQKKVELINQQDLIHTKIRENEKFLEIIKNKDEDAFAGFSPREYTSMNKEKINELEDDLKNLYDKKIQVEDQLKSIEEKMTEVQQVIDDLNQMIVSKNEVSIKEEDKNTSAGDEKIDFMQLKNQLRTIAGYVISDPYRGKIELEYIADHINIMFKVQ